MKKSLLLIFVFLQFSYIYSAIEKDTTFQYLSKLLDNKEVYMHVKEQKISEIKRMLQTPNISEVQRYDINLKLYDQYKTYISDSAIHFAQENLQIAHRLNNILWIDESKLALASLYTIAGMYIESIDLLRSIDRKTMPEKLLVSYYDTYKLLYSSYSSNNLYTNIYYAKSNLYRDSLLNVLDKTSNHYKIVYSEKLLDQNRLEESKQILQNLLEESKLEDHERAVLAYALANVYKKENNIEQQRVYYTISAVCDIKNAIKENASLQALAGVFYEMSNIDNAYKCIKSSMEDAIFCNARLRTFEVSKAFPIIDTAYQDKVNKQKEGLLFFLILVSLLSLFLIAAVIYVYRQMKRVAGIRKELYRTNVKLNELNTDLQKNNVQLNNLNGELSEANRIKETYIGHFLDLCSMYINKLEKYQNTLNKKAVEKRLDELYKMLKSRDMIDNELKDLFDKFDNIFLHLYPSFVEDFNSLLLEKERFVLKPNELLNTELRIFALIRLGIVDSSKIASFLHYSANTIYNYRTRVRNKAAVPREEFELLVTKIGVKFTKNS
ncbi:DUF6377 domain-containing protein [Dysgonomonas sp. ZJ279]|uniref:DUF6377 domain-containing protein n=1 Tax=Dysgonomonas sp. ZJ279 TaxID=2709796 RepID=UPI0013EA88C2|nr:DUF6377 domain-containing protein [Dysgonomonas sp. ZJ279]